MISNNGHNYVNLNGVCHTKIDWYIKMEREREREGTERDIETQRERQRERASAR